MHDTRALMVDTFCTVLLAQADSHHLHQAALIPSTERSMRLNAVKQDDAVCLRRIFVHIDRLLAHTGQTNLHGLHRAFDRATHILLGNAIVGEDLGLTFGGCTAVAAHGRHDIRLGSLGFDEVNNRACHQRIVVDATAAAGDGNTHARLDLAAQRLARQFLLHRFRDLILRNVRAVKHLSNLDHFRYRHVFDQISNCFQEKILLPHTCSTYIIAF